MRSMRLGVELENAMDLGDRLWIERRAVTRRDNSFAPGTVKMAAPISDDAVAAVRSVATAAVTDNGVIRNSLRDRDLIDCYNETIVRGERVHAVGKTLQLQCRRVSGQAFAQCPTDCEELRWRSYQHRTDASDPVAGKICTTMWCGHEDHAPNIAPVIEDENFLKEVFTLGVHRGLGRRMSKSFDPESRAGIGKQSSCDTSAHAMSHHYHRFAQRIFFLNRVEFLPENGCAIRIRITAGIAVEPNLVIAPEIRIAAEIVHHWHPRYRCVNEAMDHEQHSFVWIIGFKPGDPGSTGVFLRPKKTGEPQFLGFFPRKQHGI